MALPAQRQAQSLPAVVSEGLVGLRHAVDVLLALERPALFGLRVQELAREPLGHRLLAACARERDQPADREGASPALGNLHRDLVGGAADSAGADLQDGGESLDGLLERLDRLLLGPAGDQLERVVDDPLGRGLLPVDHHLVDDLLHQLGLVDRVGVERAYSARCATRHAYLAFTPYCERAFLRSDTPAASSVPRTTLYRTPGRSLTRPPRTSTTECSCRLWP